MFRRALFSVSVGASPVCVTALLLINGTGGQTALGLKKTDISLSLIGGIPKKEALYRFIACREVTQQ